MKRVVFMDGDMPTICGVIEYGPTMDTTVTEAELRPGRMIKFASLVRVTTRAVYFKEPMVPKSYGSMHPGQR